MNRVKHIVIQDLGRLNGELEIKSNEYLRKSKDISDCWYGKAMGLQAAMKEIDGLIERYRKIRED